MVFSTSLTSIDNVYNIRMQKTKKTQGASYAAEPAFSKDFRKKNLSQHSQHKKTKGPH